jgi:AcrR family transcriptional regulator
MARPVKKSSEQWESEILSATQTLFITKGYEETSISDIMNVVGGAKGMFYRCFQSKEEILNVLVEKWAEQYAHEIMVLLNNPQSSFNEKFIRILSVIKEMSSKTAGMDAFFSKSNELMINRLTEKMRSTLAPLLATVLNDGVDEGLLSIADTDFYANYIIHGSLGALNHGSGSPKDNIHRNLASLPKIIADILNIDVSLLTNENVEKGGE